MSNITENPNVPSRIVGKVTFPKFMNTLGIIPTSYKDSMSYYEIVCWLCKFLEETVIPTVNEIGNGVQELQNLYVELNSYVTNYFDNLDVQEEINNKLDEMAESGELYDLIERFVFPYINEQNSKIDVLESRMDSFTELPDGSTIGDAELIDGRVGYEGTTYSNIGDAIRTQTGQNHDDIFELTGKTHFNKGNISKVISEQTGQWNILKAYSDIDVNNCSYISILCSSYNCYGSLVGRILVYDENDVQLQSQFISKTDFLDKIYKYNLDNDADHCTINLYATSDEAGVVGETAYFNNLIITIENKNNIYNMTPLKNYVTPEDFGAYGDNEHDDTTAITNLLNSGEKNISLTKDAIYLCTDQINVTNISNVIIEGNNATIKLNKSEYEELDTNTGFIYFENNNNITIKNLNITTNFEWMRRPGAPDPTFEQYLEKRKKCYSAIFSKNCSRLKFINLEISNVVNGIWCSGVTNSNFNGLYVHNTFADAFFISGASRYITVENCFCTLIDDDCYSADGYGSSISANPAYINFVNCYAIDIIGALCCLEGSFYTTVSKCKGLSLSLKPLKLGYLTDDGANAPGDYQTVENCYIDISSAYLGGNTTYIVNQGTNVVHAQINNNIIINRFSPIEFRFYNSDVIITNNRILKVGMRFNNSQVILNDNILDITGGLYFSTGLKPAKVENNIITFRNSNTAWDENCDFNVGATILYIHNNRITSQKTTPGLIVFSDSASLETDYGHFERSTQNAYKIKYLGVYDLDTYNVLVSNFADGQLVKKGNVMKCIWNGNILS